MFKRLMIQKNIELQLQALQLIQQKGQQKSKPTAPLSSQVVHDEEDEIMKEVLRLSKEEYDNRTNQQKKEEDNLKKTLNESFEEHQRYGNIIRAKMRRNMFCAQNLGVFI